MSDLIARIIEKPKKGYYPHNDNQFSVVSNCKKNNKKYFIGNYITKEINSKKNPVIFIRTGYWTFFNKGNNIVECGIYSDNGQKYGTWCGYFGGKKDLKDRLKYKTNYINDKIIGIQKFYLKTKDKKSVYLWKEIEYDESGNLTGNMTKYNEQNKIIYKTYKTDDIIIQERYDEIGNVIIHREFNLFGKPINVWFNNKCIPRIKTKMYNILIDFYKKNYEENFPEKENYCNMIQHIYIQSRYKEFLDEIKYIKTFNQEEKFINIIITIYDKNDTIICEINKRIKKRKN
jgi:hypothetical protein